MMTDSYNVSYANDGFDGTVDSNQKPDGSVTLKKVVSIVEEPEKEATIQVKEDDDPERPQWDNQCEFILSAVGYAVGLGNVWRFPYLAYVNGGGTFLLPYAIMLVTAGLPLFFMELALGQYSGQGPTRVFGRLAPALKGLGFSMLMITFYVAIYYNVIIAWTLFYMFSGMQSVLPWTTCNSSLSINEATNEPKYCVNSSITPEMIKENHYVVGPSEDYYTSNLLGLDKEVHSWDNLGGLRWQLVLCLFSAWVIVCLCLIKGVQSAGKVVYFTALFPFVVLIILFIYGMTLEGASIGIAYYVTPDFNRLTDISVWVAAANQIFYSLGPTFGGLVTLSSYNKFDNNCHRDALLVAFLNCGTSVFAGFVVFSIIGFMAHETGQNVPDVIKSGPGLAFIAYPEAVSKMGDNGVPQFMAFLFFFMLLTLGLDSMFTFVETLTTCIMDHFKQLAKYKAYVVITTCFVSFICGLSMCTNGGIYMFELIDGTSASWNILVFALIEVVLVAWGYGVDNFLGNIEEMGMKLSRPMKFYWRTCWTYVTPILLAFLVIFKFVQHQPLKSTSYKYCDKEISYDWPNGDPNVTVFTPVSCDLNVTTTTDVTVNTSAVVTSCTTTTTSRIANIKETFEQTGSPLDIQALGLMISLSSMLLIPLIGIYQVWKRHRKGKPLGMALFRQTHNWKPSIASSPSIQNLPEQDPKSNAFKRQSSRRGSRKSFRKHLPPNAETLE